MSFVVVVAVVWAAYCLALEMKWMGSGISESNFLAIHNKTWDLYFICPVFFCVFHFFSNFFFFHFFSSIFLFCCIRFICLESKAVEAIILP